MYWCLPLLLIMVSHLVLHSLKTKLMVHKHTDYRLSISNLFSHLFQYVVCKGSKKTKPVVTYEKF